VKGLKVRTIRNASHALNIEQPAQVNEAILSFISAE
jgi:pimeloyl-ACP methyl ester carboxylesterase